MSLKADDRNRTCNPLITNQELYLLSYISKTEYIGLEPIRRLLDYSQFSKLLPYQLGLILHNERGGNWTHDTFVLYGRNGEWRIWTLGGLPLNGFQDRRNKPLCQLPKYAVPRRGLLRIVLRYLDSVLLNRYNLHERRINFIVKTHLWYSESNRNCNIISVMT